MPDNTSKSLMHIGRPWVAGLSVILSLWLSVPEMAGQAATAEKKVKKIVLIAGKKSHGPEGNGIHDYGWSARLLKVMLEHSNIKEQVKVETHLGGWPKNPGTLEDADTIMIISDGRDGDMFEEAPHLASPERVRFFGKQMQRGCGFITFHFSTFAPDQYAREMLNWNGAYFGWQTNGKRQWYSAIKTLETGVQLAAPNHPIVRGVKPFRLQEEFYYNLHFQPGDKAVIPILTVPSVQGRDPDGNVVAWARQREDGGRGFGTTCGHFYDNWKNAQFRKLILNAIAWSAKLDVPEAGVEAQFYSHNEIEQKESPKGSAKESHESDASPIRVLVFAGNSAHKWHNWERTTPAIKTLLERDSRMRVEVSENIEDLGIKDLTQYQVIVLNYANWHDPKALTDKSKSAFTQFLGKGGGLLVLHFANGAFHFSLPEAGASDWPEYRKIVRRVWNHNGRGKAQSGHDAFQPFKVQITSLQHPITTGLGAFDVTDELYFNQDGNEPIEPLIEARSKSTKQNEPLAWTYSYGKARVFQTLLGHSEKTYDAFEAREMLRRAVAWVAGRQTRPMRAGEDRGAVQISLSGPSNSSTLVEGRFGKALDARQAAALVAASPAYRRPPLTVECWARLQDKGPFNILVANELKSSSTHWEMFTFAGTGIFTVYMPGMTPDHIRSSQNICDDKWHYLAMIFEPGRVRLYIDAQPAADQAIESKGGESQEGALAFGNLVSGEMGCEGYLDEIRISQGVRTIDGMPTRPFQMDKRTIGLWHFDRLDKGRFLDESASHRSARIKFKQQSAIPAPASPNSSAGLDYQPADPRLKAILLDRSTDDAYTAVKVDGLGRVFVGGREGLFVFEPKPDGTFAARQELFRFPPDSIIIGLELRGNDLYVMTASGLYLIPGGRVERVGLKPRRLLWGLPLDLHVSFHCLAWGPEGDLYLNHGDPLLNYGDFNRPDHWGYWTLYPQPEGTRVPFTGVGSVLRIRPDGSRLQVVAGGFRGPVGLAFDHRWNLFTNDNDHESKPDLYTPARLMHVTPHIDFGWPRGWLASKIPDRSDLVEPMTSTLGRGVPVGLAYYDEPYLREEYRRQLLMARWESLSVTRYPLLARGASFSTREGPFLHGRGNARPAGVAVGRGGRVFVTVLYLAGNVVSPHCVSDLVMITRSDDQPEHPFAAVDVVASNAEQLWADLSNPSWERRREAHTEILRRGGPLLAEAVQRLRSCKSSDPAINHLPWLAGAAGTSEAASELMRLATSSDAATRQQAIRVLGEFTHLQAPAAVFASALTDTEPSVRLAGLHCLFKDSSALPVEAVVGLARSDDTYLRQTATQLLASRATLAQIDELTQSPDERTRLAAVLAAGLRLTIPPKDRPPPTQVKLSFPQESAFFKVKLRFADGEADLRSLGRVGSYTMAEYWKAIEPGEEGQRLFDLLLRMVKDDGERVRLQAAYYLSLLRDPRSEPLVVQVIRSVIENRLSANPERPIGQAWIVGPFADSGPDFQPTHSLETTVVDLAGQYDTPHGKRTWQIASAKAGSFDLHRLWASQKLSSCYLFLRLQSVARQPIMLLVDSSDAVRVWHNGRGVGEKSHAPVNGAHVNEIILDAQPGSNDLLIRIQHDQGGNGVRLRCRAQLEVTATLPEKLDQTMLADRLREAGKTGIQQPIGTEFLQMDWQHEARTGNAAQGRRLFGSLGCAKCHAITADQRGGGGPSLAEAARRFTVAYLVESILLPNKQVAEPFRATQIMLTNGRVLAGLVVNETAEEVDLLLPDATQKKIRKAAIEERRKTDFSPMPAALVRTPDELRDLLSYLLSERPLPP